MSVIALRRLIFAALIAVFVVGAARLASTQSPQKPSADAQAGARLFHDKGCAFCHGEGGAGANKAPALTGMNTDNNWTPARITNQIMNGGQKMPPFADSLTDEEVAQLVAFLKAKNRPAPPPPTH